ncbi:ThiF family adenylyltransferase [Streptomyces sp. NBC_01242]|uniref:ThiF family adenylyltransferase n=1 Tax=Streptomyces sp. NBC_01242 TaxID=2903795 RepID=UPI00224D302E|nr:ThiF family adenylyltransferase [Streptomyces sp. NBC_01242]MCX4797638.1 ThiF family adenylyltransferase [Streptomyces sp. NBC_01242]
MSKRKPPAAHPSSSQRRLLDQLTTLATAHAPDLRITARPRTDADGLVTVPISIRTGGMPHAPGGLQLNESEDFLLTLPATPMIPPQVRTPHIRFAGTPHVLQGNRLCLYLDPAREWDPAAGITPVVNRLWQWLTDAAAGTFDPATALYHPVGGVLHHTPGTPTIVVREPVSHRPATAWLTQHTTDRLDLASAPAHSHSHRTPILPVDTLPLGAGSTLAELLAHEPLSAGAASPAVLTALAASALRNPEGTAQHFVLAVRRPAAPAAPPFLLAGRLQPQASDTLRRLARHATPSRLGGLPDDLRHTPVEWCYLSDERPEVTTRRDTLRPVRAFQDRHIHIWGCGGIGSWAAEMVARAGASHLTLSDPGRVTGGLLVRQNYTEHHIGMNKATALASHLRSIRDDIRIDTTASPPDPALLTAADQADLIIDATVSITAGRFLDLLAQRPYRRAVLAQLATDSLTASLGVLTIAAPGTHTPLSTIDHTAGGDVLDDPSLEAYHALWAEPAPGDELRPTRGCSTPTFHGSAADLMATTATLVNLLGTQMRHPISGTHLCAQPHTGTVPTQRFIPHTAA